MTLTFFSEINYKSMQDSLAHPLPASAHTHTRTFTHTHTHTDTDNTSWLSMVWSNCERCFCSAAVATWLFFHISKIKKQNKKTKAATWKMTHTHVDTHTNRSASFSLQLFNLAVIRPILNKNNNNWNSVKQMKWKKCNMTHIWGLH